MSDERMQAETWLATWAAPEVHERLVALACRYVRDSGEAEDVAQETLLRARQSLPELRSADRAEAWLFRICRHTAIDRARARRVRRHVWCALPQDDAHEREPPARTRRREEGELGWPDLRRLPPPQRLLLALHYDHGLSQPTLCRMTGLSVPVLRVRLYRARGACRRRAPIR